MEALLKNLPQWWINKVFEEEAKLAQKTSVVKWVSTVEMVEDQVKKVVEKLVGPIKGLTKMKGCFLLEISQPQCDKLVGMKGLKVSQTAVTLEARRKRMGHGEIFDWLQTQLRIREESDVLKGSLKESRAPRYGKGVSS